MCIYIYIYICIYIYIYIHIIVAVATASSPRLVQLNSSILCRGVQQGLSNMPLISFLEPLPP